MKTVLVSCPVCKGSGWRECAHCQGQGKLPGYRQAAIRAQLADRDCPICSGLGQRPCSGCGGKGVKHKDVVDLQPALTKMRQGVGRFASSLSRSARLTSSSSSAANQSQVDSTPATTRIEVHYKTPPSSAQIELIGCAAVSGMVLLAFAILLFGIDRVLVAGEAFFLFSAWAALRAADLLRAQHAVRVEAFRQYMVICFGICSGCLAAYLILTTPEGQAITAWVTSNTIRIIGSLLLTIVGLGALELMWQRTVAWIGHRSP